MELLCFLLCGGRDTPNRLGWDEEILMMHTTDIIHLDWLKKFNLDSFSGFRILDLGCRTGQLCEIAADNGANLAVGVDIIDTPAQGKWQFVNINLDREDWSSILIKEVNSPLMAIISLYLSLFHIHV